MSRKGSIYGILVKPRSKTSDIPAAFHLLLMISFPFEVVMRLLNSTSLTAWIGLNPINCNPNWTSSLLIPSSGWAFIFPKYINPFVPNVPFLYSLKTSENLIVFWYFQRVEKGCTGNKWVKFAFEKSVSITIDRQIKCLLELCHISWNIGNT